MSSGTKTRLAILDTNVLIRAVMNPTGLAAHLAESANGSLFQSVTSQHQLWELNDVLRRNWMRSKSASKRRHEFYVSYAERSVIIRDPLMCWPCIRDPKDDYVVELAKASDACIVTGDSDFFAADLPDGIEVFSAGWFARHILKLDIDTMFPYRPTRLVPATQELSIA